MAQPGRSRKRYKVHYAGVPDSERIVYAYTAKEAGFEYFRPEMHRNHLFVSRGLREEIFSWKDYRDQIPNFDEKRPPFCASHRNPSSLARSGRI